MDPNAALRVWRTGDHEESMDAFHSLLGWIRRGGFVPKGLTAVERSRLGLEVKSSALKAEKIRLDKGGYDRSGRYWGVGEGLYNVYATDGSFSTVVRAPTAKAAKEKARKNPKCNPENPRRHFPSTPRGRPRVSKKWTLEIYHSAGGPKLGSKTVSADKWSAYKQARQMVGKKYRGQTVNKVILDGPK